MNCSAPITAIVIFRNERPLLQRCLAALQWCNEIIAIDMESSDGSLDIARRLAHRVYRVPRYPIAEPTRVAAAKLAENDWILLVDPDEIIPEALAGDIRQTLAAHLDAGALCLPMRFYFKQRLLEGTIWGPLTFKRRLIHRRRCALLPLCNRISELLPGEEEVRVEYHDENHVRHYWSDSYRDLLHKHFRRYAHLEAAAMVAQGQRFSLRLGCWFPLCELNRSLKDFDGWRLGVRGFALSAIYFVYIALASWLTLYYQFRQGRTGVSPVGESRDGRDARPTELPTLTEVGPGLPGRVGAERKKGVGSRFSRTAPSVLSSSTKNDSRPLFPSPRITIITPSFNQAAFLEQTLKSVLDQGYPNLQYIVVDGGSSDGSVEIINRYRSRLDHVIIEPDRGQTEALNKGLRLADGELVGWLCSDDTLLPGSLETLGRMVQEHPGEGWFAGACVMTQVDGQPIRTIEPTTDLSLRKVLFRTDDSPFDLPQPGVFWRRKLHDELGLLDESLHYTMDFEFWLRLLANGYRPCKVDGALATYRLHEASKTCSAAHRFIKEHVIVEGRYARELGLADRMRMMRRLGYMKRAAMIRTPEVSLRREVLRRPWWLGSQQVRAALAG